MWKVQLHKIQTNCIYVSASKIVKPKETPTNRILSGPLITIE